MFLGLYTQSGMLNITVQVGSLPAVALSKKTRKIFSWPALYTEQSGKNHNAGVYTTIKIWWQPNAVQSSFRIKKKEKSAVRSFRICFLKLTKYD